MTEPTSEARTPATFLDSIGTRGRRRAEPRLSIALAGAGCALAVLGILILSGDTGSGGNDEFNQLPGIVLTGLVLAAGFLTLSRIRTGPLATAGTVAAVLAMPALMFFVTFDEGGFPPWETDGILVVSTVVWLGAYVIGPGRGRPLFLAAGLLGAWATLLQVTEDVFDLPFTFFDAFFYGFGSSFEDDGFTYEDSTGFGGSGFPDPTTVALLSLGIGIAYVGISRWLDRRGHAGAATPLLAAAFPALAVGVAFIGEEIEAIGAGLVLTVIGAGLALHGSQALRRGTTWIGGGACALGLAIFAGDLTDDATLGGLLYAGLGVAMVAVAHLLVSERDEPDEMALTEPALVGPAKIVRAPRPDAPPPDPPVAPEL